jgi:predicted amidohydrolase
MRGTIRIGAVQPRSRSGAGEERNSQEALEWLDRAADAGADLVLFPEGYPGPASPLNDYDVLPALAERAIANRVHVVASRIEPAEGGHYMTLRLIDDSGESAGVYHRSCPSGPYVYHDIPAWGFEYVAGDEAPRVVETRLGRIGMLVCSEIFVPELSRLLALDGADVILYPSGGAINELLPAWRTLVWARAIENLVFTVATQNLYADDEKGLAMIAAPEGVLAQSATAGLLVADLNLDRLEFLRSEDEKIEFPKRYAVVPGTIHFRRPEFYGPLVHEQGPR